MQLHLVFGFKLYHLGTIPVESHLSKWHVLRLQEKWINTCCNLVTFYWETPHPQRFAWRTFREGHWVVLKLISLLQILGVQQYPQGGWATYPQGVWARELYTLFSVCLPYVGCYHNILREDELVTYPRWGWARELNFVLSINFMLVVSTISSGRMSSLHILSEDELENCTLFSL